MADISSWVSPANDEYYFKDASARSALANKTDKTSTAGVAYGTCSTAAATAAKVIAVSGKTGWTLEAGAQITVKFTHTNTANNPTFNVNGTGAKSVWYNTALITTSNLAYAGTANRPMAFVYDGTQFVFIGWSVDTDTTYSNASLGQGYGTCSTAAATVGKTVTLSDYALVTGGIVSVKFTYNVPASATMNINSKGAKSIYYKGSAITDSIINAGDVATFIYDGSKYHLIAIDTNIDRRLPVVSTSDNGKVLRVVSGKWMTQSTSRLIDVFYPVGSVYTSTSSTAPTFGGTWSEIKVTATWEQLAEGERSFISGVSSGTLHYWLRTE